MTNGVNESDALCSDSWTDWTESDFLFDEMNDDEDFEIRNFEFDKEKYNYITLEKFDETQFREVFDLMIEDAVNEMDFTTKLFGELERISEASNENTEL